MSKKRKESAVYPFLVITDTLPTSGTSFIDQICAPIFINHVKECAANAKNLKFI
jgi:hypothetical protein